MLSEVSQLRNACAHNSCIINNLRGERLTTSTGGNEAGPSRLVVNTLKSLSQHRDARRAKLRNERIRQIVTAIVFHSEIVTSAPVREHRAGELRELSDRMTRHLDYYDHND
jgi:hypothetical protein